MKVLLVNLPWQRQGKFGVRAGSRWPHIKDGSEDCYLPFPFFLAYAASLLEKHGIDITIIDAIAEQLTEDKFIDRISQLDCDLLLTETSTPSLASDLCLLEKISKYNIPVILCGPHIEIYQTDFLQKHPFIKYVLYGEYELTLLELVQNLMNGKELSDVKGLIWRCGCEVIKNPARPPFDINVLPWPHREMLPMEKYCDLPGNIPYPSVQMLASRGCPFGCNFCLWPQVLYRGNHYRPRNVEDVVNEMEHLVKKNGFKSVYFDDDTFNIGKQRMLSLSEAIKVRGLDKTPWAMMARADLMDEEILTALKSAGLHAVKYGVESSSQSLVNTCSKGMDLSYTTKVIELTKELGIKIHLTFCFGLLGETKETIKKSIDYALHLEPDTVQFSLLTPFPGTSLFDELDKQGKILIKDWTRYDGHHSCVFKPDNLSPGELELSKQRAYFIWAKHSRQKTGFRKKINKFIVYSQQSGIKGSLRKTLSYLIFWIARDYERKRGAAREARENLKKNIVHACQRVNNRINLVCQKLKISRLKAIFKSKIKSKISPLYQKIKKSPLNTKVRHRIILAYRHIRTSGPITTCIKIKNYYLDLLGIMSCKFAFKGPTLLQIDLTNQCNNNCIACWCNSPLLEEKRNDGHSLYYGEVIRLIDMVKKMGTKEIYLSGGGEPFMYPQILEVIRHIKKKRLICYVNTNGTLIDEKIIYELVRSKLDHLIISLWASSPRVYKTTHPNKNELDFYRIEQMLRFLAKTKNKHPRLHINNVISNLNWQDIHNMVMFAIDVKADAVDFTLMDAIPQRTDKLLLNVEQRKEALYALEGILRDEEITKRIKITGVEKTMNRLRNPFSEGGNYDKGAVDIMPCYAGWTFSRVMANGDVNSCLKAHRIPVGNVYEDSFRTIWNSPQQNLFRLKGIHSNKDDIFFSYIGNDPNASIGCHKGCDDLERNLIMHKKLGMLTNFEKRILQRCAGLLELFAGDGFSI